MQHCLESVRAGAGATWLVEGDAGLGKSRLLAEAAAAARTAGFVVGEGVAEPGNVAVDLGVLMRALFAGPRPVLERSALVDPHASPERCYWLLQDLESLLEEAALQGPVAICLDDLQWIDGGTVAALRTLPSRLASLPICWVLAFRPLEPGSDADRALAQLLGDGATKTTLARLDRPAIVAVATDALGAPPDEALLTFAGWAT